MSVQNFNPLISNRRDLVYYGKMQKQKNYLLKVDSQFLSDLETSEQILIEGDVNDQVVINANNNSYRVKGVNISTTMLVMNQAGTIFQESSNYLQVHKFDPPFHQIYRHLTTLSCMSPDKQGVQTLDQLIQNYSFTDYAVKKQCCLNQHNFQKLRKVMDLVKVNRDMEEEHRYLYIGLPFSIWIMRQIFKVYNQIGISSFQSISVHALTQKVFVLDVNILDWIIKNYEFVHQINTQNTNEYVIKMSKKSIIKYIIGEMALAKKQYTAHTFNEVLEQMVMIYMPAEAQITSNWFKDKQKQKQKQELFACKLDYFIEIKNEKYIYYDYLEIEPDITDRLKMLSGFKKKWRTAELKAIFRGFDAVENGKPMTLQEVLLKKFRKYGDEYEIKFILPSK